VVIENIKLFGESGGLKDDEPERGLLYASFCDREGGSSSSGLEIIDVGGSVSMEESIFVCS